MKLLKRVGALALAASLMLGILSGCKKTEAPAADFTVPESVDLAAVTDPYLTVSGMSGDTVVATVGGSDITAAQVLYWIAFSADSLLQYYSMYGMTELPWDSESEGSTLADTMKQNALDTAALYTLLPQMGKEEGLELSEEFTASFDESMTKMAEALGGEELMAHYLWQFPLTKEIYTALCQSEDFNSQIVAKHFGEGAEGYPTDEDVFSFLEDEQQCYFFKHILLKVEEAEDGTDNSAEQKAKAEDLLAQLKASSDPMALFDELMQEHTEDPGLATNPNGYLGTASATSAVAGKMVTVVEEAALALEEGQFSEVLENTEGYHGYHIVLRLPVAGNVAAEEYRDEYIQNRMNQLQQGWLEEHEVKTNENFDKIDAAKFYQALTVLRQAVSAEQKALEDDASASTSGSQADASAPAASSSQS